MISLQLMKVSEGVLIRGDGGGGYLLFWPRRWALIWGKEIQQVSVLCKLHFFNVIQLESRANFTVHNCSLSPVIQSAVELLVTNKKLSMALQQGKL